MINTANYSTYATDNALQIAGLGPTIDLRDSLYVPDGTVDSQGRIGIRHINPGETGVTAENIWIASDIRPSGARPGHGEGWSRQPCPARDAYLLRHSMPEFLDALDFAAQTPTSSSYGLMQVMWGLSQQYRWQVIDPATGQATQSPRYLVDTPEALAVPNGGSIPIGSSEDVERYWNDFAPSAEPAFFTSRQDFFGAFITPLRMYTGGGILDYGTNIVNNYQLNYTPQQTTHVFN